MEEMRTVLQLMLDQIGKLADRIEMLELKMIVMQAPELGSVLNNGITELRAKILQDACRKD